MGGNEATFNIKLIDETGSQPGSPSGSQPPVSPIQSGSPTEVFAKMLADVAGGGKALPVVVTSFANQPVAQALANPGLVTAQAQPPQGFAAYASARSRASVDMGEQMEMGAESMRLLAMGQIVGSTGLPGANIARFALARRAMQNEAKRQFLALSQAEPGSREAAAAQAGFEGAQLQAGISTAGMYMAIVAAVDQAVTKIGEAMVGFYKAETAVMTSQLRERGAAIAFDVAGHARAQIGTERARMEQTRQAFEAGAGWIPIVGGLGRGILGGIQAGQERDLAEREQTIDAAGRAQERFRTLAQFNPAMATQAAMQDVGRLYRTMDQASRLGGVYSEFSERYFQHEAQTEELFARLMPGMMGDMLDSLQRTTDRQIAEMIADQRERERQSRIASGEATVGEMLGLPGSNRASFLEQAMEQIRAIRADIGEINDRERRQEMTREGVGGLLSLRAPGEGRGPTAYEASRESATAAMRRAAMEVPPPVIDLP